MFSSAHTVVYFLPVSKLLCKVNLWTWLLLNGYILSLHVLSCMYMYYACILIGKDNGSVAINSIFWLSDKICKFHVEIESTQLHFVFVCVCVLMCLKAVFTNYCLCFSPYHTHTHTLTRTHSNTNVNLYCLHQKIRTVELDGKTIKLQIVSSPSYVVETCVTHDMHTHTRTHTRAHTHTHTRTLCAVGHCWSGEVQDNHFKLLQRCQWHHHCL